MSERAGSQGITMRATIAVRAGRRGRVMPRAARRHPAGSLTLRQVDPLIRELIHYRDVIARKTQEGTP
jgi:hypothetical protein